PRAIAGGDRLRGRFERRLGQYVQCVTPGDDLPPQGSWAVVAMEEPLLSNLSDDAMPAPDMPARNRREGPTPKDVKELTSADDYGGHVSPESIAKMLRAV